MAVGVHVLAQESDFPDALGGQVLDLSCDVLDGPGALFAAAEGHDAICAGLVAAVDDRDVGGDTPRLGGGQQTLKGQGNAVLLQVGGRVIGQADQEVRDGGRLEEEVYHREASAQCCLVFGDHAACEGDEGAWLLLFDAGGFGECLPAKYERSSPHSNRLSRVFCAPTSG